MPRRRVSNSSMATVYRYRDPQGSGLTVAASTLRRDGVAPVENGLLLTVATKQGDLADVYLSPSAWQSLVYAVQAIASP